MTQISITIPRFRLVNEPSEKSHYVYVIEVIDGTRNLKVERRYSAFHYLHRELRKNHRTPAFPPKRVRSFQPKVLERRRLCLEQYLQTMVRFGPTEERVLNFLGVCKGSSSPGPPIIGNVRQVAHRPIFHYTEDPYATPVEKGFLPDIVARGVLMALYE